MLTKKEKEALIEEYREKFRSNQSVLFVDFVGIDAKATSNLRRKFKKEGVDYSVIKNTLLKISAKNAGLNISDDVFAKSTAVAFSNQDFTQLAKLFFKPNKKEEERFFVIKGGVMDSVFYKGDFVEKIAQLPPRTELLSKLLGSIKSPLTGLVGALSGVSRNFVYVLSEVKKKKEAMAS